MPTIDLVGIIQPWGLTDECSGIDAPRFREKYWCTDFYRDPTFDDFFDFKNLSSLSKTGFVK
jgi:hypothetical protein